MWQDFKFKYLHLLECVLKQNVSQAPLVYKGLPNYAIGYLYANNHGIILYQVDRLKVI